jgi:diguanylate cyclase (GGDEF)-like protein
MTSAQNQPRDMNLDAVHSIPRPTPSDNPLDQARLTAPFAVVGLSTLVLGVEGVDPFSAVVGVAVAIAMAAVAMVVPWRLYRGPLQLSVPAGWLLSIAILRNGAAGHDTGIDLLTLLPVLALALYGSRTQVPIMIVGVAAVLVVPVLLTGSAGSSPDTWRRIIITLLVFGFAGLVVQRLVEQARLQNDRLARSAAELARSEQAAAARAQDLKALLDLATELDELRLPGQIRGAVCRAICDLTGANAALLFEPQGDSDLLVATGWHGVDTGGVISLDARASTTGRVIASGRAEFIQDLAADPRVDTTTARELEVNAGFFQPITGRDGVLGVLVAYWRTPQHVLSEREQMLMPLFSAHAANAIERADLEARLSDLARTDALTGLANRRAFDEAFVRVLAQAKRGEPVALLMIDIDQFKRFNDAYGHPAGDRFLAAAAGAWMSVLRPRDLLARYGGEEFAAILPGCRSASAARIAERMRLLVPLGQTVSVGVAEWRPEESGSDLIERADSALYVAKRTGRNRVVVSTARHGTNGSASRSGSGPVDAPISGGYDGSPSPWLRRRRRGTLAKRPAC